MEIEFVEGREGRWPTFIRVYAPESLARSLAPLLRKLRFRRSGSVWYRRVDPRLGEAELLRLARSIRAVAGDAMVVLRIRAYFNPDLIIARLWPYIFVFDSVELNDFNVSTAGVKSDEYVYQLGRGFGFLALYYPFWRDDPCLYADDWWDLAPPDI
ncbi:MAG: hypothetical protein QXT79_08795 [Thermofilaceae archaeon]